MPPEYSTGWFYRSRIPHDGHIFSLFYGEVDVVQGFHLVAAESEWYKFFRRCVTSKRDIIHSSISSTHHNPGPECAPSIWLNSGPVSYSFVRLLHHLLGAVQIHPHLGTPAWLGGDGDLMAQFGQNAAAQVEPDAGGFPLFTTVVAGEPLFQRPGANPLPGCRCRCRR